MRRQTRSDGGAAVKLDTTHHHWTHVSFDLSASKMGQVGGGEEYTISSSSYLSEDVSRVKELLYEVFPNGFPTVCLLREDVGDK